MAAKTIQVNVVDFGGAGGVLRRALQELPYEMDFDDREKLVRVQELQAPMAPDLEPGEFDPKDAPHYLPSDPSQWAWIVGSFVTLKVADHLIADAYQQVKWTLKNYRKDHPKARLTLDDAPFDE